MRGRIDRCGTVERLRAEIAKGEASGIAEDFDWDEFRARKWAEHAAKP